MSRAFMTSFAQRALLLSALAGGALPLAAQWTRADYDRALGLRNHTRTLVEHMPDAPEWIAGSSRFVYRRSVGDGFEFVAVDADAKTVQPAFDAVRLAAALTGAMGKPVTPQHLPFVTPTLDAALSTLAFDAAEKHWSCTLTDYVCHGEALPPEPPHDPEDEGYDFTPRRINGNVHPVASPDGQWEAYIEDDNLFVCSSKDPAQKNQITTDGSAGNYYALETIAWSPDSKQIAVYRVRPGYRRLVHYVESSPADQSQPKDSAMVYPKAGDALALPQPVLIDVAKRTAVSIDNTLFPNPYELGELQWWKDGRGFTFEDNQRGHQVYRVIEVDAHSAQPRVLIEEKADTVVNYPPLTRDQYDHGKTFRANLEDGRQIVWASERDGWEHLYLYDGKTGQVLRQITKGDWVVRAVDRIDEKTGTLFFEASGVHPDEDPYFVHAYRIQLDGTGMTELTPEKADHTLSWSPDGRYFVDTWSRVDLPPTMVLRNADGSERLSVDKADASKLLATGWKAPEVFHAPGRDGKTAIWGVVYKPAHFDPQKKYPVVEDIYAGPQGSFVPKSFSSRAEPLTELGFVVVQMDGMGTNNRSRAFHDVAWRNLKDAGFADRILWHKAYAAAHPWYDVNRVGVFGTSAGGQNALAALLFHPEFYKAAVANCGSHDNRMDKIWWNEQWMGWPVGPWYAESSNVDNAWRLEGKLLLVVGEMDKNVDPSTTLQVVDRLIKADKDFELAVVPGGGHGAGGDWGARKLMDFFVRNLEGAATPNWNQPEAKNASAGTSPVAPETSHSR
ncbi:DPP IV N-terminal domain-containing protein [Telmatobacter bradus]|uniref:S9 family peptidase n=1 Tax=Telmatobacter bradus TaxID=474953 RepID=UPI003B42C817